MNIRCPLPHISQLNEQKWIRRKKSESNSNQRTLKTIRFVIPHQIRPRISSSSCFFPLYSSPKQTLQIKKERKEGRNKAEIRELWRHIMRMCFHILNSAKLNLIISASPFRSIITLKRKRCHFFGQKQNHCESLATQMNHAGALLFNFAPLLKTLSSSVPWIFQL